MSMFISFLTYHGVQVISTHGKMEKYTTHLHNLQLLPILFQ